ncbi:MAG: Na+-transporting NADH:ubiquinone oxidoreductase subunit C [Alphaproteobacteria bacterium]|jgi:Na+-transporting NADH:ubiquinone oxidoreductase subunit C
MANPDHRGWWRRFAALPKDSTVKTLAFAFAIALVSAFVVSVVSVTLRPLQKANLERERQALIVSIVSRAIGETGPLTAHVVELATGRVTPDIDPVTFDQEEAAKKPESSIAIPREADSAGINRRANYATVFIRREGGKPALIVLPVHGAGYQSTLYGYLALRGDGNTVAALNFYKQGETPGLGARIAEPAWQSLWPGKRLADDSGTIRISVVRGMGTGPNEVDGITGATRTGTGVSNLLRFWLGDYGFRRFLDRVKAGEI